MHNINFSMFLYKTEYIRACMSDKKSPQVRQIKQSPKNQVCAVTICLENINNTGYVCLCARGKTVLTVYLVPRTQRGQQSEKLRMTGTTDQASLKALKALAGPCLALECLARNKIDPAKRSGGTNRWHTPCKLSFISVFITLQITTD